MACKEPPHLFKVGSCFCYGETGYYRKDCRNGLVCYICTGVGHSSRICKAWSKKKMDAEIPLEPLFFMPTTRSVKEAHRKHKRDGIIRVYPL